MEVILLMKVSFFYLKLTDNPDENEEYYTDDGLYCPILDTITNSSKSISNGLSVYLYGFTNDKKIADIFEKLHEPSIIFRVDKKMSSSEFILMANEMPDFRISQYDTVYSKYNYSFDDICTRFIVATDMEIACVEDEFVSYIDDDIMEFTIYPYSQFKDRYIWALDALLYCTYYMMFNSSDDDSYIIQNDLSYGYTAEGHHNINIRSDTMSMYISLFKPLLRKDEFGR